MPRFLAFREPDAPVRNAVLLVNLGTPAAPTAAAVRRYLAEFLGDPRIVEQPRWLWWLVLHGIILRLRPRRSARAYARIWTAQGSPLQVGMGALAARLQARLGGGREGGPAVRHAMRYGDPSIPGVLRELGALGLRRLIVLPLFPQYSATTAASVLDAIGAELRRWRAVPELRFINDYHVDAHHIEALARSVEAHWREHGRGDALLLSFHGIPERYVREGDPYRDQVEATAQALRKRLGLDGRSLKVGFQSRVGREPWLAPYADRLLAALPGEGVRRLDVLCPGFSVDCLETLEEIAIAGRETFLAAGGDSLRYIPCLNDSADQVEALAALVVRHAQGWDEFDAAVSSG
ncbi:MAG TPA: ferrochelatase [Dokdonella sp.]|uniref:ferrochelatase n=1 Tax=Dokdonella sp. TaxID=2291710 RepID=UPI0025C6D94B|nr:ferrochelatase [Dokdonella sp.]MBX3691127.1 ferrochelatase [Dokdonella sp.]MCW5566892.1 ferrochelatase [Dokdonella sp.]HNR91943.1 ferrochelatase [Dokdonella sp.]